MSNDIPYEYTYQYNLMGEVEFTNNICVIADPRTDKTGADIAADPYTYTDLESECIAIPKVRNKEKWNFYTKIRYDSQDDPNDEDCYKEVMDLIWINQKLFSKLPGKYAADKLGDLYYEWISKVDIQNYNICFCDTEHFKNNSNCSDIPSYKSNLDDAWYSHYNRVLLDSDEDSLVMPGGTISFVGNDQYDIYAIKDSKSDEILAIDLELEEDDNTVDNDDEDDKDDYESFTTGYDRMLSDIPTLYNSNPSSYGNSTTGTSTGKGYNTGYTSGYANKFSRNYYQSGYGCGSLTTIKKINSSTVKTL